MSLADFLAVLFWLVIIYSIAFIAVLFRYPKQNPSSPPYQSYFLYGLTIKLLGVLAFDAIYVFYYGGGDTQGYYILSQGLYHAFFHQPDAAFQVLLFTDAGETSYYTADITRSIAGFFNDVGTFTVVRFSALFSLVTANSFWANSLLFAALSYGGVWAIYRVMVRQYPALHYPLAWAVLAMPSVVFWGSGILKDSLSMAGLGALLYGLYHLFFARRGWIHSSLMLLLAWAGADLIWSTKEYIIIAFVPAFVYWLLLHYRQQISDRRLRTAIFLVCLMLGSAVLYLTAGYLAKIGNVLFMQFVKLAMDFQGWHGFLNEHRGGSGYSLGTVNFTVGGILSKFPASVIVTLFRPWLYEVRNPVMLLTALESMALLGITLYTLARVGVSGVWSTLQKSPFAVFCLTFALLFAFAVGFTSYNFGALARYKIPCLSFYAAFWIFAWHSKTDDV